MSSDAVWSGNNHTNTNIKLAAGNLNDPKVASPGKSVPVANV
jgi:hypothetical protein